MLAHFRADDGGFYDTADDAEALVARPRSLQDNALPSGAAMATHVLLRLAALTGEGRYREAAEAALAPIVPLAAQHPTGFAQWLQAVQLAARPITEVAIVGDPLAADTQALLAVTRAGYHPERVLALSAAPEHSSVALLAARTRVGGRATAYVCHGFACRAPVTEPAALAEQLAAESVAAEAPAAG